MDIAKAFDSIRWDYLLLLLRHLGFPARWCDWTAAILSTSSSRVLLNGVPNPPIKHGRGLRQGDPLSPLLFVIAIDPLQRILQLATDINILTRLRGRAPSCRILMYADDAALFIAPRKEEIR
ncbi:reverse transcriptase domain-containing protein [Klebsiella pneumoniae]